MKIIFFSCAIVVCFVLLSCQSRQEHVLVYADFPVQKELRAIAIELDTAIFRYPFRMRAHGDKMIVKLSDERRV